MGPPSAASGATWPTDMPQVAPENRPSVTKATSAPWPVPLTAAVMASISCIPGPPLGPSYRTTMASPGRSRPDVT